MEATITTIAYRSGVLCTDSAVTSAQHVRLGTARKVARGPDGSIVAAAGRTLHVAALLAWVEDGMTGKLGLPDDEFGAILVRPDGGVHHVGGDGCTVQIDAPFHAEGSGYQLAMGAMAAGATAEQAVQIACRFEGKSGDPIQTIRLGDAA